jgi:hypothetical protein
MAKKSLKSSRRASGSVLTSLPKGWVYEAEKVNAEVKNEVVNPAKYLMLDAPLTCSKHKAIEQLDNPHRRHRRALSITEAPLTSPSVSRKTPVTPQLAISGPTWTRPTHL